MNRCPRCNGEMIWQSDWDDEDEGVEYILSAYHCPIDETSVIYTDQVEKKEE